MRFSSNKNLIKQIFQTIWSRKWLISSVILLVVISGMLATLMITPKFEATMSILVSRDRIDPQINPSDKNSETTQTAISDEEFNSELELIKSSEVIAGVVKDLDLLNNQKPKPDTRFSVLRGKIKSVIYKFTGRDSEESGADADVFTIEKMVNSVAGNLDVTSNKKSRVIKIGYTDTDPLRAKKVLEKLYEKFVGLHVQMNNKPQAGQVFSEQTDKYNQQLSQSTNALKSFDSKNGITGAEIGVQRELLLKQLYDAQAQVNATRTEIGETEKRITDLKGKIALQPVQIQTGSVSKYVGALDRMKEELAQLQQQRTQLLQKFQPNSRFVRDNQERLDQLKKSITEETNSPPQERSYALNDLRRRLESDLSNAQTSFAALRERETNINSQAEKLRAQVEFLNSKSIERTNLERNRNVNEEAYLLYQKKTRENEISQVLNKEQVMNFGVVDAPRTDGEQKNPKPLLNFLVLMVVGTTAGFAGAIILEKLSAPDDDFIFSASELARRIDLPLLASIPIIEIPKRINHINSVSTGLALPPVRRKETD